MPECGITALYMVSGSVNRIIMNNKNEIKTLKNCVTCGRPVPIRPYMSNSICSNCTRWKVISDDIERNADYIDDDWSAAQ